MDKKPWYQSRTIWGLIITGVSLIAPKYQPIAEVLPTLVADVGKYGGLLLGLYGRLKASPGVTFVEPPKSE